MAKSDHDKYGDEIGLSLLGLPCPEFEKKYHTKDFCIWMFSLEDKKSIVNDVFIGFKSLSGFIPESTSSYYMDADLINYIKKSYPGVKCAVATCWKTPRPIIHAITHGTHLWTAAPGLRGFRQNKIRTRLLPMKRFRHRHDPSPFT